MSSKPPLLMEYSLRVWGRLEEDWPVWLGGVSLIHTIAGETLLTTPAIDSPALNGLLARLRDLDLVLLELHAIERC